MNQLKAHEFQYCFAVGVDTNKTEFKLETASPIQTEHVKGIKVRAKSTGSKSINGNDLVADATLNASFLTLKQRNAEVYEKIPLEVIAKTTDAGEWYEVDLPNVDMNQSSVLCSNQAALIDGEDYEFIFKYQKVVK